MHYRRTTTLCLALAVLLGLAASASADFPLKDGDTWVFAGDSITAQKLHTNYIEAFCYARYPKINAHFRNSGIGGDTIPKVIARFDYDVAAWKPTIVSVELGMNDKGGFTPSQYIANMGKLTEMIKTAKARPVFFSASAINNGDTMAKLGGNARLNEFALSLKEFAAKEQAPFADQFHPLIDIWGKNKPREVLANAVQAVKPIAAMKDLEGSEHLRAFLEMHAKDPPAVTMQGDPVHPGPNGQLMMAAALLQGLGAEGFVSSATIEATGKAPDSKGCKVENVKADKGTLTFERTDECLPFPIPNNTHVVLPMYPTILELSQYTLKVTGLEGDAYQLSVDKKPVAVVKAKDLDKGINLTAFDKGPIADQGKAILATVQAKEELVQAWRAASKTASAKNAPADAKEKLEAATKAVEAADAKIRAAATPKTLVFELKPMK